eukprot:gene29695-38824_t
MRGALILQSRGKINLLLRQRSHQRRYFELASLSVVPVIQKGIELLHVNTGIPWWATFTLSTVMVRLSLVPLVRFQLITSSKLAKAVPELRFLWTLFSQRVKTPNLSLEDKLAAVSIFRSGVSACFVLYNVSIVEMLAYPLANATLFITFVYSLRDMVIMKGDLFYMYDGGLSFCKDLTYMDKSFILPLLSLSASYLALELSLHASNSSKFMLTLKDALQSVLVVSVPAVMQLPAGVFFYWIPSHLIGITQTYLLRQERVRKLFLNEPEN